MKKILYVSRHDMTADMEKLLTEKLWKVSVDKVELIFSNWEEINPFIWKYDEFIIVAPNDIMGIIINKGINPLQFLITFRNDDWSPSQSPRLKWLKRIIKIEEEML
jgi:flavorubredoxin